MRRCLVVIIVASGRSTHSSADQRSDNDDRGRLPSVGHVYSRDDPPARRAARPHPTAASVRWHSQRSPRVSTTYHFPCLMREFRLRSECAAVECLCSGLPASELAAKSWSVSADALSRSLRAIGKSAPCSAARNNLACALDSAGMVFSLPNLTTPHGEVLLAMDCGDDR